MLSLSMIVRNEEERLAACLDSVKGLVDEMVVVDTGSTDGTIAIAQAAGARVELPGARGRARREITPRPPFWRSGAQDARAPRFAEVAPRSRYAPDMGATGGTQGEVSSTH